LLAAGRGLRPAGRNARNSWRDALPRACFVAISLRRQSVLALAHSAAMHGIDGYLVRVEADSAPGTPSFSIIGLPDRSLGESRERVRAAIINSGLLFAAGKVLVNLSPADVRKEGPG